MVDEQGKDDKPFHERSVGPFWVIHGNHVVGEAHALTAADIEDRKKGLPDKTSSHNDLWPRLQKPTSVSGRTYMTIPRGRVVYLSEEDGFAIYSAREIQQQPAAREAVIRFFGLQNQKVHWKTDDKHYDTQDDLIDEGDDFPDL